jgi:hypothetical protein
MNFEKLSKKQPVETLLYKNWREWFKLLKMHFVAEELDFVINQTEEEYCTVLRFTDQSGTSTDVDTPVTGREDIDKLGKKLEGLNIQEEKPQQGRINIEKQRLYYKASAKVLYTITICIDPIDTDLVSKTTTAKEVWDQLYTKYSKVRLQANRDNIKKITIFKLQEGTTIENTWTFLKTTCTRVVTANKDFRHAFTEDIIFEHLFAGLLDKYLSTRTNIDTQQYFTVQDKLDILIIQKERLFTDKAEKGLVAQSTLQTLYRPKHRSKYNSGSESESRQNLIYWIYNIYRYLIQDCLILL